MIRAQGRDYLRRLWVPKSAARLAILAAIALTLAIPAVATGRPEARSVSMAGPATAQGTGPAAPAVGVVLYDQYNSQAPVGAFPYDITSQDFEFQLDTSDSEAADDFVVPANTTWNVDGIDADGEYRSSNTQQPFPTGFHVRFWSNDPATNLPANMIAERLSQTYTNLGAGDVQITVNPAVPLPAGTYWVSVQARLDFGTNTTTYQWYWHHRTVQANQGAAWRNPGNYWGTSCTTFKRRSGCQNSTNYPDQVFRLYGSSTTTPPPPPPPPPAPPPVRCHVPSVVGRTVVRARPLIIHAHCRVGQISYMLVSRRKRGKIVGQNPHAGRNLPRNSRVNLLVGR